MTGAPKVRAMEIIAELEPTARGPYCGSLGYIGFDGSMDTNILIRTFTSGRGWLQFPVGGGIVADSDARGRVRRDAAQGRRDAAAHAGVGVSSFGGTDVQAVALDGGVRRQKACHCPASLLKNARGWQIASVPYSRQRLPDGFRRWPTTVLHADSTATEPIDQPLATYRG